jgi:predicted dehydrogenase
MGTGSVAAPPTRIAILGAARIASKALIEPAAEHGGAIVTAVGASSVARAREFAISHGIPAAGSYADVIARPDVDLVYIALPPSAHAHWTIRALEAGKHVFLEKPSALDSAEVAAMLAAQATSGRRLVEAFHYGWHPLFLRAMEVARSGVLGRIERQEAAFSVPIPRSPDEFRWRADLGGGALADLGCYPCSWVRGLAGEEPVVEAASQTMDNGVDVRTSAQLRFPGGAVAEIRTDMDPAARELFLDVRGTRGHLRIENPLAPQHGHAFTLMVDGSETRERFALRPTFAYQFDGVIDALNSGAPTRFEGAEIAGNMALMDSIRAAAARA